MIYTYFLIITLLFNIVLATSAHAYIDPNTGGFFFQAVAPFVYGILAVIVVFWKRITGFVRGIVSRKKEQNNPSLNE
jgi:undecaprenyl pyrophosphate phosphatase UppP